MKCFVCDSEIKEECYHNCHEQGCEQVDCDCDLPCHAECCPSCSGAGDEERELIKKPQFTDSGYFDYGTIDDIRFIENVIVISTECGKVRTKYANDYRFQETKLLVGPDLHIKTLKKKVEMEVNKADYSFNLAKKFYLSAAQLEAEILEAKCHLASYTKSLLSQV